MTLYRGEVVFDDSNYRNLIGDGRQVSAAGDVRFLSATPRPPDADTSGYAAPFGDHFKVIPRSEWDARLDFLVESKSMCSNYCDFPAFDQNGTNYCWNFGVVQAGQNKRRQQGLPTPVQLSPASIGGPITGYRNRGGWEGEACEYMQKMGCTTVDKWPQHTISSRYDTAEVTADRANYKITTVIEASTFDEFFTLLLLQIPCPVAYNWWRHVVYLCDPVRIERGSYGVRLRNSWSDGWGAKNELGFGGFAVGREGRYTPSSGFGLVQMTASTKNNPASTPLAVAL